MAQLMAAVAGDHERMNTITDLDLVNACADTYNATAKWDHLWTRGDVHIAHRRLRGFDIVASRGSFDLDDWIRDVSFIPIWSWRLGGFVHYGFYKDMPRVPREILAAVPTGNIVLTGHSLGASHSNILAGLLLALGIKPRALIMFGEPRSDFGNIGRKLKKACVPVRSYRNRHDPVCEVPLGLGRLLPYRHEWELTGIDGGSGSDPRDPFNDHHIALYQNDTPAVPI